MFEGFARQQIETDEATINLVRGGSGYPILLLHGYPQTHVCWHRVAPVLAQQFTVVCPDLRGCGDSSKPESDAEHLAYSKRVVAQAHSQQKQSQNMNVVSTRRPFAQPMKSFARQQQLISCTTKPTRSAGSPVRPCCYGVPRECGRNMGYWKYGEREPNM